MPPFHGSSINGFLIERGDTRWGPFDTPDEAARWAIDRLAAGVDWAITPYRSPVLEDPGPRGVV